MNRGAAGQSGGSKFRQENNQTEADPLGQRVPKGRKSKFRRESAEAKAAAEKLHREDATGGSDTDTPPTGADAPPKGKAGAGKAKPDKDAQRLEKSKLRMEKSAEKLDKAKETLAAQKPLKKPGPVKKVGKAVSGGVQGYVHAKIFQVEDENVGVEGAHRSELVGEAAVRGTSRYIKRRVHSAPTRAVRKAENKNIRATANHQFRMAAQEHPELQQKNAVSRLWQKQRLKRQYQKRARETAKAAGKTTATSGRTVAGFVKRHPVGAVIALCCVLLLVGLQSCASSLVTVANGLVGSVGASTYHPAEEGDLRGAEAAYLALEAELQDYLDSYERTHSYDEYHYDLAEIKHDPYVLLAIVSALHEGQWTVDEVQGTLQMLFDKQYILTERVTVETHYDSDGDPYSYYICTPTSSPRPGDLVFFVGTYDTAGMSHCGIYVGDGMMLHCGDPIQYANLNSSYWQSHFYAYGRLP